jgi:hypothetical protein
MSEWAEVCAGLRQDIEELRRRRIGRLAGSTFMDALQEQYRQLQPQYADVIEQADRLENPPMLLDELLRRTELLRRLEAAL